MAGYLEAQFGIGRSPQTLRTRREQLGHVARQMRVSPDSVTPVMLVEWFGKQTHWGAECRKSYRNTLRSFFEWAHAAGITATNPALALPPVRTTTTPLRPAPDDVVQAAFAAAGPREKLMLRLGAEAGLRRAEIAQVHVQDVKVDTSGPRLLVRGKGNRIRQVPITPDLAAVIQEGAAGHTPGTSDNGWLFPNFTGGHLTPKYVGDLMAQLLPGRFSAHSLRRRFGTRAYIGTKDVRAVQMLLGHSSLSVTERYISIDDDQLRTAMMAAL
ncbi:hypothetical protein BOH72_23355 [Mycobacterium sp. WY10]|nr:hypothetical protein BOH72_23355 [Mycobacterium sp. WY10]